MCSVAVAVEQSLGLFVAPEGLEYAVAGNSYAQGKETASEKFSVARDVRVGLKIRGGAEAAEAVQTCEDFVEDDGEAGPGVRIFRRWSWL